MGVQHRFTVVFGIGKQLCSAQEHSCVQHRKTVVFSTEKRERERDVYAYVYMCSNIYMYVFDRHFSTLDIFRH